MYGLRFGHGVGIPTSSLPRRNLLAACAHKMQTGSKLKFRQPHPSLPPFARPATTPRVSVRSAIPRSVAVLVTRCNQPPPTIMKSINPEESSGQSQRAHQPSPRTFFPSSSSFSLSLSSCSSSSSSSSSSSCFLHQCSFSFFLVLEECCLFVCVSSSRIVLFRPSFEIFALPSFCAANFAMLCSRCVYFAGLKDSLSGSPEGRLVLYCHLSRVIRRTCQKDEMISTFVIAMTLVLYN